MNVVKVSYELKGGEGWTTSEYSYVSEDDLAVGDIVMVPVRETTAKAIVRAVNVPEEEIATFKDKIQIIPAGSRIAGVSVQEAKEGEPPSFARSEGDLIISPSASSTIDLTDTTSTLIRIKPQSDEAVMLLHIEALKLRAYANELTVKSDQDVKQATNDLSMIANLKKALEVKRKEYVGPINEHLKAVNETFKAFTAPVEDADRILRAKILDHRAEQERLRQEQERINALRMEAARAEMELKGELTESVELVETVPEQPDRYRAEAGTLGKAKIAKWEEIDFAQVPDEYKMLDSAKIGKVVRAGLRHIPGIRIWEDETLRVTPGRAE